jgi:hypothetical protein
MNITEKEMIEMILGLKINLIVSLQEAELAIYW